MPLDLIQALPLALPLALPSGTAQGGALKLDGGSAHKAFCPRLMHLCEQL